MVHDCVGVTYDRFVYAQWLMKKAYIDLGFKNHINIIVKCILIPNFEVLSTPESRVLMDALIAYLETAFPLEENVLSKKPLVFLNSLY